MLFNISPAYKGDEIREFYIIVIITYNYMQKI